MPTLENDLRIIKCKIIEGDSQRDFMPQNSNTPSLLGINGTWENSKTKGRNHNKFQRLYSTDYEQQVY